MKGVLPWLVRWARRAGTRDFYPALAALVSPVQNVFFLTVHCLNLCVSIAQQAGQAVVQGRLSLNVRLRFYMPLLLTATMTTILSLSFFFFSLWRLAYAS
jgi:hypothetical protein